MCRSRAENNTLEFLIVVFKQALLFKAKTSQDESVSKQRYIPCP